MSSLFSQRNAVMWSLCACFFSFLFAHCSLARVQHSSGSCTRFITHQHLPILIASAIKIRKHDNVKAAIVLSCSEFQDATTEFGRLIRPRDRQFFVAKIVSWKHYFLSFPLIVCSKPIDFNYASLRMLAAYFFLFLRYLFFFCLLCVW